MTRPRRYRPAARPSARPAAAVCSSSSARWRSRGAACSSHAVPRPASGEPALLRAASRPWKPAARPLSRHEGPGNTPAAYTARFQATTAHTAGASRLTRSGAPSWSTSRPPSTPSSSASSTQPAVTGRREAQRASAGSRAASRVSAWAARAVTKRSGPACSPTAASAWRVAQARSSACQWGEPGTPSQAATSRTCRAWSSVIAGNCKAPSAVVADGAGQTAPRCRQALPDAVRRRAAAPPAGPGCACRSFRTSGPRGCARWRSSRPAPGPQPWGACRCTASRPAGPASA